MTGGGRMEGGRKNPEGEGRDRHAACCGNPARVFLIGRCLVKKVNSRPDLVPNI